MQQQSLKIQQAQLQKELISMGFQLQKIQQTLKITKNKQQAIDLLLSEKPEKIENQGSFQDEEEDYKMIFVVRMDLKLQIGKISQFVATAALNAYKQMEAFVDVDELKQYAFFQWSQNGQKKIVVKSPTEKELLQLIQKAKAKNMNYSLVYEKPSKLQIENNNEVKEGKQGNRKKGNKGKNKQEKEQIKQQVQQVKQQMKQGKQQTIKNVEQKQILILGAFGPASQSQIDPLTKMFKLL